jgi:hypothetical protein
VRSVIHGTFNIRVRTYLNLSPESSNASMNPVQAKKDKSEVEGPLREVVTREVEVHEEEWYFPG